MSSYSGSQSARPMSGGMPGRSVDDPRIMGIGGVDPGQTVKDRTLGFGGGRPEAPLPPDASSTLFVEGLPSDCTRREVSRILSLARIFTLALFFFTFPIKFNSFTLVDRYLPPVCWVQGSETCKQGIKTCKFIYLFFVLTAD